MKYNMRVNDIEILVVVVKKQLELILLNVIRKQFSLFVIQLLRMQLLYALPFNNPCYNHRKSIILIYSLSF